MALILAYARYEADLGPHGQLMSEATDDRANPNYYEPDRIRFVADPPITDWADKARKDMAAAWQKELGDDANMNGLIFPVRKVVDQPLE